MLPRWSPQQPLSTSHACAYAQLPTKSNTAHVHLQIHRLMCMTTATAEATRSGSRTSFLAHNAGDRVDRHEPRQSLKRAWTSPVLCPSPNEISLSLCCWFFLHRSRWVFHLPLHRLSRFFHRCWFSTGDQCSVGQPTVVIPTRRSSTKPRNTLQFRHSRQCIPVHSSRKTANLMTVFRRRIYREARSVHWPPAHTTTDPTKRRFCQALVSQSD